MAEAEMEIADTVVGVEAEEKYDEYGQQQEESGTGREEGQE